MTSPQARAGDEARWVAARALVAIAPLPAIVYLANWAWFQYGVGGPSFTPVDSDVSFINPPLAGLLVLSCVGSFVAYAATGWHFAMHGTRLGMVRFASATIVVVVLLVGLGSQIDLAVI